MKSYFKIHVTMILVNINFVSELFMKKIHVIPPLTSFYYYYQFLRIYSHPVLYSAQVH